MGQKETVVSELCKELGALRSTPLTESAALSGSPCNYCRFTHKSSWMITVPATVLEPTDRHPLLRQLASCRPPCLNAVNPFLVKSRQWDGQTAYLKLVVEISNEFDMPTSA